MNKELLEIYRLGFNDELDLKPEAVFIEPIKQKAYNLGRLDAIFGDNNPNIDYKSDEEILKQIKDI